jgi:hypothetical protein
MCKTTRYSSVQPVLNLVHSIVYTHVVKNLPRRVHCSQPARIFFPLRYSPKARRLCHARHGLVGCHTRCTHLKLCPTHGTVCLIIDYVCTPRHRDTGSYSSTIAENRKNSPILHGLVLHYRFMCASLQVGEVLQNVYKY